MNNEKIKQMMNFVSAAIEAAKGQPAETIIEFECPVCGGNATVSKAACNGHHHSNCTGCGMNFME